MNEAELMNLFNRSRSFEISKDLLRKYVKKAFSLLAWDGMPTSKQWEESSVFSWLPAFIL